MAGGTFGTRMKLSARGKEKWYATLSFDGIKTERFGGYKESDAYALGIKLTGEYNQNRAGVVTSVKVSLDKALEAFYNRKVDRKGEFIKENTNDINEYHMKHFVEDNNILYVSQITKTLLVDYALALKVKGNGPGTVNMRMKTIKCFLNFCLSNRWIKENPFPNKIISAYKSSGHVFTAEEMQFLLTPIVSSNPRDIQADALLICAIKIAQHQGLRRTQIWSLHLEDYIESEGRLLTIGLKRKAEKKVLCHPVTLESIKKAAEINACEPHERVFKHWSSPPMISQAFRRKCGTTIKLGTFHDLKHTAVSELGSQGFSNVDISEITNTSPATIAAVYTHAIEQKLKEKFVKFGFKS